MAPIQPAANTKASLSELQGELEDYRIQQGSISWSVRNPDQQAVSASMLAPFDDTDDLLHDYSVYLLADPTARGCAGSRRRGRTR